MGAAPRPAPELPWKLLFSFVGPLVLEVDLHLSYRPYGFTTDEISITSSSDPSGELYSHFWGLEVSQKIRLHGTPRFPPTQPPTHWTNLKVQTI